MKSRMNGYVKTLSYSRRVTIVSTIAERQITFQVGQYCFVHLTLNLHHLRQVMLDSWHDFDTCQGEGEGDDQLTEEEDDLLVYYIIAVVAAVLVVTVGCVAVVLYMRKQVNECILFSDTHCWINRRGLNRKHSEVNTPMSFKQQIDLVNLQRQHEPKKTPISLIK